MTRITRTSFSIFTVFLVITFSVSDIVAAKKRLDGPSDEMGQWEIVNPTDLEGLPNPFKMQSVHTVLLPDGKVLMASGSSLRDAADSKRFPRGSESNGVYSRSNFAKLTWDDMFNINNNTGIYDPINNTFEHIDGPRLNQSLHTPAEGPNVNSHNNDLFCSGQLQLPDGRVLFVGGTQFYTPYTGAKTTYIFDWRAEPGKQWTDAGLLKDGHWYPSIVPLADGRFVVLSGLSAEVIPTPNPTVNDPGAPFPSHYIEIFDPSRFDASKPQEAWSYIDAHKLPNSPWQRPVRPGSARMDSLVLYPRVFPLPDGRLFLSHEGSIQLFGDTGTPVNNRNTYFLKVADRSKSGAATAQFSYGPDKPNVYRHYGSAVVDPMTDNLLFLGGQQGPERGFDGYNADQYQPGVRATTDLNTYHLPDQEYPDGRWQHIPDFLGDSPADGRVNHLAVILPTRQLLVTNGGNQSLGRPLFSPLLYTPDENAKSGYRATAMNWASQPRLYHNSALLLPDGRVLSVGGQVPRASYNIDTDEVTMNGKLGEYTIPNEIWQGEIFSPPYLFLPGPRPEIKTVRAALNIREGGAYIETGTATQEISHGKTYVVEVDHMVGDYCALGNGSLVLIKLGSVTHGWDSGQRLINLDIDTYRSNIGKQHELPAVTFTVPELSANTPPAYYMMFYVNCKGKPSKAKMVRLGSS
jgi:hypothetical protein